MDALVEDVPIVVAALDSHNARHLVNENVVFERLEIASLTTSLRGQDLVNHVVRKFLVDFGMAPPEDPGPAPLGATGNPAGPTSSRIGLQDSPEVCVLSPATVQAFDEPYSPLPLCLDSTPNVDVSKELKNTTDVSEDSTLGGMSKVGHDTLLDTTFSPIAEPASVNGQSNANPGSTLKNTGAIPKTSHLVASSYESTGAIPKQFQAKDTAVGGKFNNATVFDETFELMDTSRPNPVDSPINSAIDMKTKQNGTASASVTLDISESEDYNTISSSPGKRVRNEPFNERKKFKTSPVAKSILLSPETKRSPKSEKVAAHVATLSDMFPEADPDYLWNRCEQVSDDEAFNAVIIQMLSDSDYPRVHGLSQTRMNPSTKASAAAGSSKDLKDSPILAGNSTSSTISLPRFLPNTQESTVTTITSSASSSNSTSTHSTSSAPAGTAVASTSKAVKLEASASTSKVVKLEASASTSKVVKLEASASTSKDVKLEASASTSNAPASASKQPTQVQSLSEVKRRLSLENGHEAAAVIREPWQDQLDTFVQIFPDADPSFLEEKARQLIGKEDELRVFVAEALEKKEYPSRKDWQWRQEQLALQKKYTEEFSIPNFLEIIPDPFTYFTDPNRKNLTVQANQATMFLRNKYRKLRVADITSVFSRNKYNLTLTCRQLDSWTGPQLKSRRTQVDYDLTRHDGGKGINVPFLQEIAFIENEKKIVQYLSDKKSKKEAAFKDAKDKGELLQCQCCYDDEVMLEDVRTCSEGHIFCVSCLQKSSEQRIGDGHTTFPCLADCTSEFNLQTLQEILKPTVFSRLVQRKQVEEVKAAGIEDLVQCPFCDFCNIPPKDDKIFRCLNPDCMKESCRLCKEESHVPLRCEEVEKKSEVQMRTYIENQMTEALVRTCWKCARKFVKEDGCNKMTCQCGALMCYVCRQPVKDYSHFNGQGGDAHEKCPLYSDHHALEVAEVKKVAERAKKEVLARIPNGSLKHDPTKILPVYQAPPQNSDSDDSFYDSDDDNDGYDGFHYRRNRLEDSDDDDGWGRNRFHWDDDHLDEEEAEEEEEEDEDGGDNDDGDEVEDEDEDNDGNDQEDNSNDNSENNGNSGGETDLSMSQNSNHNSDNNGNSGGETDLSISQNSNDNSENNGNTEGESDLSNSSNNEQDTNRFSSSSAPSSSTPNSPCSVNSSSNSSHFSFEY
ncbi:uncharacterized protein LOC113210921 [Frankliniella occidentalis]|uniref:Uncharacterized protein LOC113210921 n=1 Tax=Frankliniella occidentalis TaxID=133901 RepID=A0A6J1SUF0_FRAOC|nr:uncharacterized protein LOC113210921 [Frankliniella occidentalis]